MSWKVPLFGSQLLIGKVHRRWFPPKALNLNHEVGIGTFINKYNWNDHFIISYLSRWMHYGGPYVPCISLFFWCFAYLSKSWDKCGYLSKIRWLSRSFSKIVMIISKIVMKIDKCGYLSKSWDNCHYLGKNRDNCDYLGKSQDKHHGKSWDNCHYLGKSQDKCHYLGKKSRSSSLSWKKST